MASIPSAAVSRLVAYLRVLDRFRADGVTETSSRELAIRTQVSPFQVRKDLNRLGRLGTRGSGYDVEKLDERLRKELGLTRSWNVAIVGMGRLGQAIADYPNFANYDFRLTAFFDIEPKDMLIKGKEVRPMSDLPRLVAERSIDIGFITVPQDEAQKAADALVEAGVKGILNFAPTAIKVPDGVFVEPVDFLAGLKRLSFYIHELEVQPAPAVETVQSAPGQAKEEPA